MNYLKLKIFSSNLISIFVFIKVKYQVYTKKHVYYELQYSSYLTYTIDPREKLQYLYAGLINNIFETKLILLRLGNLTFYIQLFFRLILKLKFIKMIKRSIYIYIYSTFFLSTFYLIIISLIRNFYFFVLLYLFLHGQCFLFSIAT